MSINIRAKIGGGAIYSSLEFSESLDLRDQFGSHLHIDNDGI